MKRRILPFVLGGCAAAALPGCGSGLQETAGPNVIYLFPDQMRNHAMAFWGEEGFRDRVDFRPDPVHTPILDSFARQALVLTSAQSNCPLSSPHRGMLLTGMYPHESGIPLNCNSSRPISSLKEDAVTVSDVFSGAGYDCAYIGKLHADFPRPNDPQRPGHYVEDRIPAWDAYTPAERRHGFNYWYSYGTFDVHKRPHYWDTEGRRHEIREWSPRHEADRAIAYLRNEHGERSGDKPFFLMIGMNPPHSPYRSLDDCMEQDFDLYRDIPLDSLLIRPNADPRMEKAESARYYFSSVTGVDREFGRILATLHELGLDDNTIVVFTSDHGETMCSQGTDDPKNSPYAESMNVPFLVRWPGRIAPRVDDLLLSSPDIMPTLLGLSGLGDRIPAAVQGRDFSSLFLADTTRGPVRPDAALYIKNIDGKTDSAGLVRDYLPVARGLKTESHTLALYLDPETLQLDHALLFDDRKDPYQLRNIPLSEDPALTERLLARLAAELETVGDPWYRDRILSDLLPYR
ncbi:sulfatase family protein [Gallalistipes aquisgranensis]|uniref:sulfatase family protein n=1 Tax=Gallalistipes aquisgranensis TaxID=2779358 RepID=UPI001CF8F08B|nr:sulfatase [Gallalistipes aquisgranensis]MBE5032643.1 sulfatase [Gallalistipes aquisgranensis]